MDTTVVILIIAALAVGALVGWLIGSRASAAGQGVVDSLRLQLDAVREERDGHALNVKDIERERDQAAIDAASLRPVAQRVTTQDAELVALRAEKELLAAAKAGFERGEIERREAFDRQLAQVKELEVKLETRFGDLAGKALETAHDAFLKRAQLSLGATGAQNEAKLKELLQPVQSTLQRYEAGLRALEHDRKGAYEGLNARIGMLSEGQDRVANEALRLRTALRSSTGDVGRWGEEQCRNILEKAGLQEGIDFNEQVSTDLQDDRSKPDFVVHLPGNRKIIIDVKCSLDSYLGATELDDGPSKEKLLNDHAKAIKSHAQSLIKRQYQSKIHNSGSYMVMFVPGENFLHAALQRDKNLLGDGHKGKIIIVGPSNLLSIILNAAALRDQVRLAERAEEIGVLGRRLYENISTLGKKAHAMSGAMRSLVSNWNNLVVTLDGHWLTTARKFDELGVGKGSLDVKEVEPIALDIHDARKLGTYPSEESETTAKLVSDTHVTAIPPIALTPPIANEDDAAA